MKLCVHQGLLLQYCDKIITYLTMLNQVSMIPQLFCWAPNALISIGMKFGLLIWRTFEKKLEVEVKIVANKNN